MEIYVIPPPQKPMVMMLRKITCKPIGVFGSFPELQVYSQGNELVAAIQGAHWLRI